MKRLYGDFRSVEQESVRDDSSQEWCRPEGVAEGFCRWRLKPGGRWMEVVRVFARWLLVSRMAPESQRMCPIALEDCGETRTGRAESGAAVEDSAAYPGNFGLCIHADLCQQRVSL